MKLFTRYNRINLFVMVIVFLLSSCAYYVVLNYVLRIESDRDLNVIKDKLVEYVTAHHQLPSNRLIDDEQITYTPTSFTGTGSHIQFSKLYDPEAKKKSTFRVLTFFIQAGEKHYEITILKPTEATTRLLHTIVIITIATILLIIISSLLINRLVLRKLWQPFYTTIDIMRNFKLGTKNRLTLPETDIEEFSFMNLSLQQVAQKADDEYLVLKEFTENASHEIQTPLAIIRSKLDLLIQDENLSETQSKTLQSAYLGIKKIARLNQSLLLLTKIDNYQFTDVEVVNVKEKIEEKISQFLELWQNNQIEVVKALLPVTINANPELIEILLNNLLSNATKHNITGGSIGITLEEGSLEICNTGPAHALDQSRLFQRFYKEARYSNHNGLGLSIIKQICEVSGITPSYSFKENKHFFLLSWTSGKIL
jgi:signal transduction histidine kinase